MANLLTTGIRAFKMFVKYIDSFELYSKLAEMSSLPQKFVDKSQPEHA